MALRHSVQGAVAEPLGSEQTASAERDWSARVRVQGRDPQRYTRFVIIMKRALLLAALALVAAVIAYSLQPREQDRVAMTFAHMGKVANDLAMIKPRLSGTDASGNPFVVTADAAIQDGPSVRRARLQNVQADITLKGGSWLTASATEGLLDADTKKIMLSGGIAIYSDSGYELHSSSAAVDLDKSVMRGDHPVSGQGPLGTLRADRFFIDRNSRQVRLMGHVQMTIYTHGAKRP